MKLRNIILMTASIAMTACSKQAVPTAIPEDAKIEQQAVSYTHLTLPTNSLV